MNFRTRQESIEASFTDGKWQIEFTNGLRFRISPELFHCLFSETDIPELPDTPFLSQKALYLYENTPGITLKEISSQVGLPMAEIARIVTPAPSLAAS